jgi:hypothetical protein
VFGQFKSNRPSGLSLTHCRSINGVSVGCDVFHLNCDYVAATQLTVDGKIEHCEVAFPPILEHAADCPNMLLPERWLGSD